MWKKIDRLEVASRTHENTIGDRKDFTSVLQAEKMDLAKENASLRVAVDLTKVRRRTNLPVSLLLDNAHSPLYPG